MYAYRTGWRGRPPKPLFLTQQVFTGMRDNYDPSAGAADKASLLRNVYPQDAAIGGALIGRPGYVAISTSIGGILGGRGQRTFQFTRLDGAEYTLVFSAGRMYVRDWAAGTLTQVAFPVGISLDATAHIGICTFADGIFFHDGVGKPIFGTVSGGGVWTFTRVTACPVLYGEPVVYYAKVTGIAAATRNMIVWSEEGDPFLGYDSGGYNNAWELRQTEQEPLYALGATNEALYYWRARSIGLITGATSDEFQASGVQESVSSEIGTVSPWAVLLRGRSFFFIDADARVQRLLLGGGLQEPQVWLDSRETTRTIPRAMLGEAMACDWSPGNLVLFAVSVRAGTRPELVLTFDADTGNFTGTWRTRGGNGVFTSLDLVKDQHGVPTLVHTNDLSSAYAWGSPQGTVWDDAGSAIEHIVVGTPIGYSQVTQMHFDRIDLSLRMQSQLTDLRVNYVVPRGQSFEQAAGASGALSVWDAILWDQAVWVGDTLEQHVPVGVSADGRWIQVRLRHNGLGEQFGLLGWTVTAFPIGAITTAR